MSYQSPIEVIQSQMRSKIEGEIYRAVMNIGVNVDKDELVKALEYDRNQYQKGYKDRDDQIVRCKDCKHWKSESDLFGKCEQWHLSGVYGADWFCADGERRIDNAEQEGDGTGTYLA